MTLAVMNKKITLRELFRNWSLVYIANFIGSTLLAVAIFYAGTFNGDASNKVISIAQSKSTLTILEALIRGILCNMIVVLAVWMATAAQDIISKILKYPYESPVGIVTAFMGAVFYIILANKEMKRGGVSEK